MPQYWLKPLGFTQPQPHPIPDDWVSERGLEDFQLTTGPARVQSPPQMGCGDRVLLHAVIHARVFAEGEILGNPEWRPDHKWGSRWPWVYPCRIDTLGAPGQRWATNGRLRATTRDRPHPSRRRVRNAFKAQHREILAALRAAPTVMHR